MKISPYLYYGETVIFESDFELEDGINDFERDSARFDINIIREMNPTIGKKLDNVELDYQIRRYLDAPAGEILREDVKIDLPYERDGDGYSYEDVTCEEEYQDGDVFAQGVFFSANEELTEDELKELTRLCKILSDQTFYFDDEFELCVATVEDPINLDDLNDDDEDDDDDDEEDDE